MHWADMTPRHDKISNFIPRNMLFNQSIQQSINQVFIYRLLDYQYFITRGDISCLTRDRFVHHTLKYKRVYDGDVSK